MRLLLIGQCALHMGRLEYGNIGNYYIIEPLIRELHNTFPNSEIRTVFQMSDDFCAREKIIRLPLDLYYSWSDQDVPLALMEVAISYLYKETGMLMMKTPYIEEVLASDIIIDFSGDMWGDNAELAGKGRFLVGLCKDYVPMLLGKKVVMLAGSPGPFSDEVTKAFARKIYKGFDLVTTREPVSKTLLEKEGFDLKRTVELACPSFLFETEKNFKSNEMQKIRGFSKDDTPNIIFFVSGWNFKEGPFDKWPRVKEEYEPFVCAIEFILKELKAKLYLASHSNGFEKTHDGFKLIHGRDYKIVEQLYGILLEKNLGNNINILNEIYLPKSMKSLIGNFDMVISGRLHAAVAAMSQYVPTVIIDYGHEPKAHKLRGFAELLEIPNMVADPLRANDLIEKVAYCWRSRDKIKAHLVKKIPLVQQLAKKNFELLRELINYETGKET